MKWDKVNNLLGLVIFIATIGVIPQIVLSGRLSLPLGLIISFVAAIIGTFIFSRGLFSVLPKITSRKMITWNYALSSVIVVSAVFIMSSKYSLLSFLLLIPMDCLFLFLPIYLKYREERPPDIGNFEFSEKYTSQLRNAVSGKEEYVPDVYVSNNIRGNRLAYATTGTEFKIVVARGAEDKLSDSEMAALMAMALFRKKSNYGKKLIYVISGYFISIFDAFFLMAEVSRMRLTAVQQNYLVAALAAAVVLMAMSILVLQALVIYFQRREDRFVAENYGHTEDIISVVKKQNAMAIPLRPLSEKQYNSYSKRIEKITKKRISYLEKLSNSGTET